MLNFEKSNNPILLTMREYTDREIERELPWMKEAEAQYYRKDELEPHDPIHHNAHFGPEEKPEPEYDPDWQR